MADQFSCLVVTNRESSEDRNEDNDEHFGIHSVAADQFGADFYHFDVEQVPAEAIVEVAVEYSSLNYKDALCATGQPGVAGKFPMIPGIDAAGVVVSAGNPELESGTRVIVAHANFGTRCDGGYCERIRVPASWCVPIPENLSSRTAMIYGTAGFTAAQSVERIADSVEPTAENKVLVTGATGGVGTMALLMLNQLGYTTVAVTGKTEKQQWLQELGATFVLSRDQLPSAAKRQLNSSQFAAAVDTVGGDMLADVISTISNGGIVTACGNVGGARFTTSVYPFILRGVTLAGIDSANISQRERVRIWNRVANDLAAPGLDRIAVEISLEDLPERIRAILAGTNSGRVVVNMSRLVA
ncbi:MAG: YhdH/YhfP family quinone oxidoreductase [Planctomycetota bacterium]